MINPKTYTPELHYFTANKNDDVFFQKSVLITALAIGKQCTHYSAELLSPKKNVTVTKKEGKLPANKEAFIKSLVEWIFENSSCQELFTLNLDTHPIQSIKGHQSKPKFDHHDDTCCWTLTLTDQEFTALKSQWKKEQLPIDLFYDQQKTKIVTKELGFLGKLGQSIGFKSSSTQGYTPKQWTAYKASQTKAK